MADNRPLTVIYLAGWGRSGSTVVGSLLGQMPRTAYIGELWNLWEDAFVRDEFCGCTQRYSACSFWQETLEASGIDAECAKRLSALKFANLGSRSMLLGRSRLRRSIASGAMREYRDATARILRETARRLDADVLVDASKTPNMLEVYAQMEGVAVKVLHIVRDPRAVAYSWYHRDKQRGPAPDGGKMGRHHPVRSTASWMARNWMVSSGVRQLGQPYQRLLYEDFAGSPGECLSSALASFKLPTLDLAKSDGMQANRHSIRGNPVRFDQQPIEIRADEAWRDEMPKAEKLVVTAMATPMLAC